MDHTTPTMPELDISDFLTPIDEPSHNQNGHRYDKSKGYRQQVEYGAKKYIKP